MGERTGGRVYCSDLLDLGHRRCRSHQTGQLGGSTKRKASQRWAYDRGAVQDDLTVREGYGDAFSLLWGGAVGLDCPHHFALESRTR